MDYCRLLYRNLPFPSSPIYALFPVHSVLSIQAFLCRRCRKSCIEYNGMCPNYTVNKFVVEVVNQFSSDSLDTACQRSISERKYIFKNVFVRCGSLSTDGISIGGCGTDVSELVVSLSSIVVRLELDVLEDGVVNGERDGELDGLLAGAVSSTMTLSPCSFSSIHGAPPHFASYIL